jgi:putative hydrolase of the HAD superfamily
MIVPYPELKTLFLDVGGTLISIDYERVAREIKARGLVCDIHALRRAEAAAKPQISRRLSHPEHGPESARLHTYFQAMLARLQPVADAGPERVEALAHELSDRLCPPGQANRLWSSVMPGVPEALEAFQALGLQLVAVSNSDGSAEQSLHEAGLRAYFSVVIDSSRVGFAKPDPRIFDLALLVSDAERGRTVHVGDMYHVDVVGARRVGISALLLDPFDDWVGVDCKRLPDLGALARQQGGREGSA